MKFILFRSHRNREVDMVVKAVVAAECAEPSAVTLSVRKAVAETGRCGRRKRRGKGKRGAMPVTPGPHQFHHQQPHQQPHQPHQPHQHHPPSTSASTSANPDDNTGSIYRSYWTIRRFMHGRYLHCFATVAAHTKARLSSNVFFSCAILILFSVNYLNITLLQTSKSNIAQDIGRLVIFFNLHTINLCFIEPSVFRLIKQLHWLSSLFDCDKFTLYCIIIQRI